MMEAEGAGFDNPTTTVAVRDDKRKLRPMEGIDCERVNSFEHCGQAGYDDLQVVPVAWLRKPHLCIEG